MRKVYLKLLSVFSFLLFVNQISAQVSSYSFVATNAAYVPITGGTTSTATGDDGTQNVPIGFPFNYGGTEYNYAIISTNGAIKLGALATTAFATSWTNALSTTSANAVIAPLWDDNNATGGSIVYSAQGAAPSRTFSVEWRGIHIGGGGSATAPVATFKVVLTETTNSIQFSYGTVNAPTAATYSLGLVDLSTFINVNPGPPATTSNSVANNIQSSTAGLTTGTTYTFSLGACLPGSLNGGLTSATVAKACAIPFSLSVSGSSLAIGLTYEWQSSPDGTTWTAISGATGSTLTTTQTNTTYYRRRVICGAGEAFSTTLQIQQDLPINCYCSTGLTTTPLAGDAVTRVTVTNENGAVLDQVSTTGPNNYSQYNNTPLDLARQTEITLAITVAADAFGFGQHLAAWVDFDHNNLFDASEVVALSVQSAAGLSVTTFNFTVPSTAVLGNTRLRVRGGSDTPTPYTAGGACATTPYGETEDYLVNITAAPACIIPTSVAVSAVTTTTATLSWMAPTPAPGAGYEYEVRTTGAAGSGAAGLGASGTTAAGVVTANVTALIPGTIYNVYVRSVCAAGTTLSNWTRLVSFKTPCNPVTTFPFTETFENSSATRICWTTNDHTNGNVNWSFASGSYPGYNVAYNGSLNAQFYEDAEDGNSTRLISPAMDLTSLTATGARLSFYYVLPEFAFFDVYQDELRVYYKTSASGPWTLVPNATFVTNQENWTKVELVLPNISSDYYIAFEGKAYFGFGVGVDDVRVDALPKADVGITGLATPLPVCPSAPVPVNVNLKNINILPINFVTDPVVITATFTGPTTGSVTTTVNTGTLAAGATLPVALPTFGYVAGTYTITATAVTPNDLVTTNNTFTGTYVVNPTPATPVITPAAPALCAGTSTVLTAASPGGSVTWTPVTGLYTDAATVYVYNAGTAVNTVYAKPANTTVYSAIATSTFGCQSAVANVTVTVNQNPAIVIGALPARICSSDEAFALTATPAGGTWSGVGVNGSNFVPGNTGPGGYTVTYRAVTPQGCSSTATALVTVNDCPERRVLLRDDAVVVYPNPSSGKFSIKVNTTLYEKLAMKVYTSGGVLAHTQQFTGVAFGRVLAVDLSTLPAGTYLVHLYYDGGTNYSDKTITVVIGR